MIPTRCPDDMRALRSTLRPLTPSTARAFTYDAVHPFPATSECIRVSKPFPLAQPSVIFLEGAAPRCAVIATNGRPVS